MDVSGALVPLITLVSLEIILGIDNVIFISILADKLPESQRARLRLWGLGLAMVMRLLLLLVISWIMKLDQDLFRVFQTGFSGKDLILLSGGLFLLYKSTREIYLKTEAHEDKPHAPSGKVTFGQMLFQVLLLDLVFSVDSIITAVGMVQDLWVMYVAVIVSVLIMMLSARSISHFITRHPSFKILALCFLMVIGTALVAEGMDFKIPKGYIYFSMAFAFFVDLIQLRVQKGKSAA